MPVLCQKYRVQDQVNHKVLPQSVQCRHLKCVTESPVPSLSLVKDNPHSRLWLAETKKLSSDLTRNPCHSLFISALHCYPVFIIKESDLCREKSGVESITVSLEEGSATVSYDPSVTDPQTIAGEANVVIIIVTCCRVSQLSLLPPGDWWVALCLKCECVTLCLCFARQGQ